MRRTLQPLPIHAGASCGSWLSGPASRSDPVRRFIPDEIAKVKLMAEVGHSGVGGGTQGEGQRAALGREQDATVKAGAQVS
jgi:hypothetical protein